MVFNEESLKLNFVNVNRNSNNDETDKRKSLVNISEKIIDKISKEKPRNWL